MFACSLKHFLHESYDLKKTKSMTFGLIFSNFFLCFLIISCLSATCYPCLPACLSLCVLSVWSGLGVVGDTCSAVQVWTEKHHGDVSGQWYGALAAECGIGQRPGGGSGVRLASAGGRSHSTHHSWARLPGWSSALPLHIEEPVAHFSRWHSAHFSELFILPILIAITRFENSWL